MLAVQGYYDGTAIRPLEEVVAKPNQRVIITILDEFVEPAFVEPAKDMRKKGMRGALEQVANPTLREREKGAWERAMIEKHDIV